MTIGKERTQTVTLMNRKSAAFNKKTAAVALVFLLATIFWFTINVVWCLHDGRYSKLVVPAVFVIAGIVMFRNEYHKKKRKHVEEVKRYIR